MKTKKVLFVCMGNICRSPSAEAIMKKYVADKNLSNSIQVDSAGTIDYHEGELADKRMIKHASERGFSLDSIARSFNPNNDFNEFDYIVTMDDENYIDIKAMDLQNKFDNRIFKMTDFSTRYNVDSIPDPYYKGTAGFEEVLDLLEDAVDGLLKKIEQDAGQVT
ncbi:MAG: low molecular weight protein-tyrosine-phosphatase [Ignavibacteria bacterium]|jgi:protein-tyrosine phosphatase